ncbi:hypothetical protein OSTOST_24756 [Ostertagia ostertagi]
MLKFELFILLHMEKVKSRHFCKYVLTEHFNTLVFDRGTATDFNYIAHHGFARDETLKFIRKACKDGKLSLACGLSAGMRGGFVHRSREPRYDVYILDFGLAHQYREADGTHKPPRQKPSKYIGKARYAPRNAYLNRELSRMDDLEMWLYVIVELVKGAVPWVHQRNPKDIFDYQKSVRTGLGLREFLGGLPVEFVDIMKEVDKLSYADEPNYNEIYGLIGNAILMSGEKEFPYDWEEGEIEAEKAGEGPTAPLKKEETQVQTAAK